MEFELEAGPQGRRLSIKVEGAQQEKLLKVPSKSTKIHDAPRI
jgi:hypothetical protein